MWFVVIDNKQIEKTTQKTQKQSKAILIATEKNQKRERSLERAPYHTRSLVFLWYLEIP